MPWFRVCLVFLTTCTLFLNCCIARIQEDEDASASRLIALLEAAVKLGEEKPQAYDWYGCNGSVWTSSEPRGRIKSPHYGKGSKYPSNAHCTWMVTVQPWQTITLHVLKLRLYGNKEDCVHTSTGDSTGDSTGGSTGDYVSMSSGDHVLMTLCGGYKASDLPSPIHTSSHTVTVSFSSDWRGERDGFSIKWTVSDVVFPGCSGSPARYTSAPDLLMSPAFEYGVYPSQANCVYLIQSPQGQQISLEFSKFSLEGGTGCPYDRLSVHDGAGSHAPLILMACGQSLPPTVTSSQDALTIIFSSDSSDEKRGFLLTYSFVAADKHPPGADTITSSRSNDPCDATPASLTGEHIDIYSPNYPLYPNNVTCVWKLQVPHGDKLRVHFHTFGVESNKHCTLDYVLVYAGHPDTNNATHLSKLCGFSPPQDIIVQDNKAMLVFHSDLSEMFTGFHVTVTSGEISSSLAPAAPPPPPVPAGAIPALPPPLSAAQGPCNFEGSLCGWRNDVNNDFDWELRSASHDHVYSPYLPTVDVTTGTQLGHYVMTEPRYAKKGDVGRLISPPLSPHPGKCMSFSYHMEGYGMGTFTVLSSMDDYYDTPADGSGGEHVLWTRHGDHGMRWYEASVSIPATRSNHQIILQLQAGVNFDSYVAVDDLSFSEGMCVSVHPSCGGAGGPAGASAGGAGDEETKRIMHGVLSAEGSWPWLVTVQVAADTGYTQCAASLIHPQWLLSAAHCFEANGGGIVQDVTLRFGERSLQLLEASNFRMKASGVFIHPARTGISGVGSNDIALVKLPYPVHLTSSINIICLPPPQSSPASSSFSSSCTAMGWGLNEHGQSSKELYHIEERVMSDAECQKAYPGRITSDMLCTWPQTPEQLQSVCSGDSGGPLACRGRDGRYSIVGVTSWITPCDQQVALKTPAATVFARVSSFMEWIEQTIADHTDTARDMGEEDPQDYREDNEIA